MESAPDPQTLFDTPLGTAVLAASARGITSLGFYRNRAAAVEAGAGAESPGLEAYRDAVLNHLAGRSREWDVALDLHGTPFQLRVWELLRAIPFGTKRTYSQVADEMGGPRVIRAVARAIGSNPVALIVPCHRVVGSHGALTGYRWGLGLKRQLLDWESDTRESGGALRDSPGPLFDQ